VLRVVRVLAPNPSVYTLEGTNTWIVGDGPTVVIDPGPDDIEHHTEVLHEAGDVAAVLLTHDHEDHADGAATFADRAGAPLWAWRLDGATRVTDGQRFVVPGAELTTVHAPGHSADHVVFWGADAGALFTGDAVVGRGTSFIDPPDGDLARYLASLHRMLELAPRTIYPGHGPILTDAPAALRGYLAHREEREAQVIEALEAGDRTVDDLVARIYADHPAEVRPLAARSVTAHLLKLEHEGRATKTGRGAAQTWTPSTPASCARCGRPVRGRGRYCSSCSLALLQGEASTEARQSASGTNRSGDRTT
jgi:glyoxylase-like metal-dependent hydrolase (beta-lactamase superfamily II)